MSSVALLPNRLRLWSLGPPRPLPVCQPRELWFPASTPLPREPSPRLAPALAQSCLLVLNVRQKGGADAGEAWAIGLLRRPVCPSFLGGKFSGGENFTISPADWTRFCWNGQSSCQITGETQVKWAVWHPEDEGSCNLFSYWELLTKWLILASSLKKQTMPHLSAS